MYNICSINKQHYYYLECFFLCLNLAVLFLAAWCEGPDFGALEVLSLDALIDFDLADFLEIGNGFFFIFSGDSFAD